MDVMRWLEAREHEEPWHNRRYAASMEWIERLIRPGDRILEVGGGTVFTDLLEIRFPDATLERTDFDIRGRFPFDAESFDAALCMEVLEHVQDKEPANDYERDAFTGSGIYNLLCELRRILRPGGRLFLTTPNVCGWHNLSRIANHQHPYFYDLHHRELSPEDVRVYLEKSGFAIETLATPVVWEHHGTAQSFIKSAAEFLTSQGCSTDLRGDDIFVEARADGSTR